MTAVARRWIAALATAVAAACAGTAVPAYADDSPAVSVNGEVTSPLAYTAAQLAALPQTTVTVTVGRRQVSDTGVLPARGDPQRGPAGRLPSQTLTVSFEGPGGEQTHTETGPPLLEVLAVAGVVPTLNTWVAAVGDDNYVATVTPAEQLLGTRPLQLSLVEDGAVLAQPRLVTDGDIKGGRYVSGVVDIYVGTGPAS